MSAVFTNVAPVFLLILIGWVLAKTGLLREVTGDALGEFVYKVALPTLIFRTLSEAHFHGASPFRLWVAYFGGVTVTWTIGHLMATHLFKRDAKIGVVSGMSGAFANNVFIGLPLVGRSIGDDGLVALSILLAVHLPMMMIAGTILMEHATAKVDGAGGLGIAAVLRQVGANLARNPLVIALALGTAFNLSGIGAMPVVLKSVIDQIAAVTSAAALISLGMTLRKYPIKGNLALAAAMAVLKLMLLPACVFALAHLLGLSKPWTAAMVLTSSVPTGINAWIIATRFGSGQSIAASVITMTTMLGVVTVTFWAWALS
ncbi:AEC family transporter [Rhizobium oryzicola]|uniref:AEC family transporter n=1 Tax=Rhizobium oryzicola TaxID=1232668 RepID=A0ABT8SPY5_9HYPH|nr:AEC family transporter [Rhizobium oryzicola]MDO1580571.1 AEC family transporter [Rhizobium oryzicola]